MDEDRGGEGDGAPPARGAIDTARDLTRRGAMAVAHTAGDNGALLALAGGAVIAGLSWLAYRRARRRPRA